MTYYRRCPACGAYLDPGEKCDCEKETAPDAANIQSGKGESELPNPLSPPILQNDKEECQG